MGVHVRKVNKWNPRLRYVVRAERPQDQSQAGHPCWISLLSHQAIANLWSTIKLQTNTQMNPPSPLPSLLTACNALKSIVVKVSHRSRSVLKQQSNIYITGRSPQAHSNLSRPIKHIPCHVPIYSSHFPRTIRIFYPTTTNPTRLISMSRSLDRLCSSISRLVFPRYPPTTLFLAHSLCSPMRPLAAQARQAGGVP